MSERTEGTRRLYGAQDMVRISSSSCAGCGACCREMSDTIVLDPYDVWQLGLITGRTFEELMGAGIDLHVEEGVILPHLMMREETGGCFFLGEDGRCTIHEYRPGICRLFPLGRLYNESGFEHLNEDIKEIMGEVGRIHSVSLGVNLDNHMRPVEVGIVSINDTKFSRPGLLDKFLDFASRKSQIHGGTSFDGMTKIHTVGKVAGDDPLMSTLSRVVTEMLGSTVKQIKNKLSRYVNISGYSLTKLIPELIFYIRWAEFCTRLMEKGLPMSKPEILDTDKRYMKAQELYNLKLGMQVLAGNEMEIICNDFEFSREHGIYIMTGPNRGGKTTFTQAVGIIFLMAQHGIFVPAKSLTMSPCDNIYTHFPADENSTVNLGRLGEESKRLSEIFTAATDKSVLLFNESLATTSFAEGLYIAKDVVRALRYLGARTIFNTHMHELAMQLEVMNSYEGDTNVASLITGIHEGTRSYKVFLAPPEGVSYARDIAEKYGVTFDQLKVSVEKTNSVQTTVIEDEEPAESKSENKKTERRRSSRSKKQ